jgi:hypothetical protein
VVAVLVTWKVWRGTGTLRQRQPSWDKAPKGENNELGKDTTFYHVAASSRNDLWYDVLAFAGFSEHIRPISQGPSPDTSIRKIEEGVQCSGTPKSFLKLLVRELMVLRPRQYATNTNARDRKWNG